MQVNANANALARELSARLKPFLPAGVCLDSDGPILRLSYTPDDSHSLIDVSYLEDGDGTHKDLGIVTEACLTQIQDDVWTLSGSPWPAPDRPLSDDPPLPWVAIEGLAAYLKFGFGENGPAFDPIPLSALTH